MKNLRIPSLALLRLTLFCLGLILPCAALAQAIAPKETALHAAGVNTVRAIAAGNAAYLSSIVDAQGIKVGHDDVIYSAQSFRNDLAHRSGVYCELFEKGCTTDHNPVYTLQHVFQSSSDPLDADLKFKLNGTEGTLDYSERGGGNLIATFTYRFAGGKWYLCNIHYV